MSAKWIEVGDVQISPRGIRRLNRASRLLGSDVRYKDYGSWEGDACQIIAYVGYPPKAKDVA